MNQQTTTILFLPLNSTPDQLAAVISQKLSEMIQQGHTINCFSAPVQSGNSTFMVVVSTVAPNPTDFYTVDKVVIPVATLAKMDDLAVTQSKVLIHLLSNYKPGAIITMDTASRYSIAASTKISKSSITSAFKALVKDGLLTQTGDTYQINTELFQSILLPQ